MNNLCVRGKMSFEVYSVYPVQDDEVGPLSPRVNSGGGHAMVDTRIPRP